MKPGDCLVLYTDGVLDTVGEVSRFGEERLMRALAGNADSPDQRTGALREALRDFQSGVQRDDVAVLAVQRVRVETPGEAEPRLLHVPG